MVDIVLLDIDGTLNEAQQPITQDMQNKLHSLATHRQVFFVTGNGYTKSVDILNGPIGHFAGIFIHKGDELRTMRGKLMWQDKVTPPLPQDIEQSLRLTFKPERANCIEWRSPRFLNFSMVGRFASLKERQEHDASWRDEAIKYLNWRYLEIDASKGGAVSIDIYSKGADKSRAARWAKDRGDRFTYIGDKMDIDGNDYKVKLFTTVHSENFCYTTTGPSHTIELIDRILGS